MDYITKIQNEYNFFTDMLKSIEKITKKTPGNGFAKMKCKERIAELEAEKYLELDGGQPQQNIWSFEGRKATAIK